MQITLNGHSKELIGPMALEELIASLNANPGCVIAELNGAIVKRSEWPQTRLADGDVIELVTFVGGG